MAGQTLLRVVAVAGSGVRPARVIVLAMLAALALGGCAVGHDGVRQLAAEHGLEAVWLPGAGFRLLGLYRPRPDPAAALHVYIEGDGRPWATRTRVSPDPSPHNPLTLRLMLLDPAPSLYLGRPCYHGTAREPPCTPWHWTHGRYSETVVEAMAAALEEFQRRHGERRVTLIGYSGGGALAMLLAARLPRVEAVVTIAADLDTDAWTGLHGYSALAGSLNPARLGALPASLRQVHFAGARDVNVPAWLVRRGLRAQPGASIEEIAGADHRCCWEARWPDMLGRIGD